MNIDILKTLPKHWDGKETVIKMLEYGSNNANQMEWIGWFFEEYSRILCKLERGNLYVRTPLDAFSQEDNCDVDFKAHCLYNKDGKSNKEIILNDTITILKSVEKYGKMLFVVLLGEAEFDTNNEFYIWHEEFKLQHMKNKKRRTSYNFSRPRKAAFNLKELRIYEINKNNINDILSNTWQTGMKNSNGKTRNSKVKINIDTFRPILIYKYEEN